MFVEAGDRMERPRKIACRHCGQTFKVGPHGRLPVFCSPSCRSMHFVKKNRTGVKVPFEERVALRIWQALVDAKIVTGDMPAAKPKPDEGEQ